MLGGGKSKIAFLRRLVAECAWYSQHQETTSPRLSELHCHETPSDFEVIPKSSGSYSDFWCGASEYSRRVKGASWTDRIYVVQGRSTSVTTGRRSAVQYTLSPVEVGVAPPPQGWLALGIKPGDSMSVQQAHSYCMQVPVARI